MFEVEKTVLVKIVGMIVRKNREVKNCWVIEEESVSGDCKDDLLKMTYHFVENSAYFVLTIELLLTVLSNYEREVALKDPAFLMGTVFDL